MGIKRPNNSKNLRTMKAHVTLKTACLEFDALNIGQNLEFFNICQEFGL